MKNKKTLISIGLIFLLLTIIIIYNVFFNNTKYITKDESLTINYCKEGIKNCDMTDVKYTTFSTTLGNKKLTEEIDKVNKEVKKHYNSVLNSKIEKNSKCPPEMAKTLNYSKYSSFEYQLYENKKYISLEYNFSDSDYCTDNDVVTDPTVLIYSKKYNKVINQKEFMKELKITSKDVDKYIKDAIMTLNHNNHLFYSESYIYKNNKPVYWLYYDKKGHLSLLFYQSLDDSYNTYRIK